MSKPYDATGKELLQMNPSAWAAFLGIVRSSDRVALVDAELSTVTAAADKILLINDDPPWLLDVKFQSWSNRHAPRQLLMYNGLLHEKHERPVASVLVVMAPNADSPAYTGEYQLSAPYGSAWDFRYSVVRLWQIPAARFLEGPLALLPLAPMAEFQERDFSELGARIGSAATFRSGPADWGQDCYNAFGPHETEVRHNDDAGVPSKHPGH